MKTILLSFAVAALFVASCEKDEPTPATQDTVTITAGEYQEVYRNYKEVWCNGEEEYFTSAANYVTIEGDTVSKVSLKNGKIYSIYDTLEDEIGKYTAKYIVFDSLPSDTLYIKYNASWGMLTQTKRPLPCSGTYWATRFFFEK